MDSLENETYLKVHYLKYIKLKIQLQYSRIL